MEPSEIHSFRDTHLVAGRLARCLGVPNRPIRLHRFPDGESLVRVRPSAKRVVLLRSLHDPDRKLVELLLAADALRRSGARHVTLVAPYLAYMRQDRVFRSGEAVSQQVMSRLLSERFDAVLTIEAHLHRIRSLDEVFSCPARSLSGTPLLSAWCRERRGRPLLVGPDEESGTWVRSLGEASGLPWIVGRKRRSGDRAVRVELPPLPEPSPRALLVDDIASSGATLASAARALRGQGVSRIEAIVVHAIFAAGAMRRLERAGIRRVISTDTIPHETNCIRVAPLLADALRANQKVRRRSA